MNTYLLGSIAMSDKAEECDCECWIQTVHELLGSTTKKLKLSQTDWAPTIQGLNLKATQQPFRQN